MAPSGQMVSPFSMEFSAICTASAAYSSGWRNENKIKTFGFEYLYLDDLCYKEFVKGSNKMGSWYRKYERLAKVLELPKSN